MNFPEQHDLHKRRFGRNLGLGLVLGAFVVLVFALSMVKITRGDFRSPAAAAGTSDGN